MSEPLRTTELFAFQAPVVKPGELVVPVLLQGGEWAALKAPRTVWAKLAQAIAEALAQSPRNPATNRPTRYNKAAR